MRLLEIKLASGATREFVYILDHPSNVLCEIMALDENHFLVIERDGKSGTDAKFKRIMLIDLLEASDVTGHASLRTGLPSGVKPVRKEAFIDLLDPRFGLAGAKFPAKIEGLALGPNLPDGRQLLLVTSDNDFKAAESTLIHAFAIHFPAARKPGAPK